MNEEKRQKQHKAPSCSNEVCMIHDAEDFFSSKLFQHSRRGEEMRVDGIRGWFARVMRGDGWWLLAVVDQRAEQ